MSTRSFGLLSFAVLVAFAVVGVGLPCVAVLAGLRAGAIFDPGVLAVVGASLRQALLSTAFSAAIGLGLGLWLGKLAQTNDLEASRRVRTALKLWSLPYAVPTVVAATAWVDWLGTHGLAQRAGLGGDWLYSLRAVVLAHVFLNAPWIALWVARARAAVPAAELDAAESLGAGSRDLFRVNIWPRIRWAFLAASVQVFGLCNMSFAIVLLLGGGPPVETLETAIYSKLKYAGIEISAAAGFAVWELALTLLPWLWIVAREMRASRVRAPAAVSRGRAVRRARAQSWHALGVGAVFLVPYAVVFFFGGTAFSPALRGALGSSLGVSLALAAATSLAALLVTISALMQIREFSPGGVRGRWAAAIQVLVSVPAGISTLVLGLGVWLAYSQWLDPFSTGGSFVAIVLVQATIFVPLAFRALLPILATVRERDLEAAESLGASPLRAFWLLEWPRWRAPLLGAAGVVAGAALSELAAVSLFASERLVPLPLLVSRFLAQYHFAEARGVSALLLLLALGLVGLVSQLGDPLERAHR